MPNLELAKLINQADHMRIIWFNRDKPSNCHETIPDNINRIIWFNR